MHSTHCKRIACATIRIQMWKCCKWNDNNERQSNEQKQKIAIAVSGTRVSIAHAPWTVNDVAKSINRLIETGVCTRCIKSSIYDYILSFRGSHSTDTCSALACRKTQFRPNNETNEATVYNMLVVGPICPAARRPFHRSDYIRWFPAISNTHTTPHLRVARAFSSDLQCRGGQFARMFRLQLEMHTKRNAPRREERRWGSETTHILYPIFMNIGK